MDEVELPPRSASVSPRRARSRSPPVRLESPIENLREKIEKLEHPVAPKDTTPIIIDGEEINRDEIPKIKIPEDVKVRPIPPRPRPRKPIERKEELPEKKEEEEKKAIEEEAPKEEISKEISKEGAANEIPKVIEKEAAKEEKKEEVPKELPKASKKKEVHKELPKLPEKLPEKNEAPVIVTSAPVEHTRVTSAPPKIAEITLYSANPEKKKKKKKKEKLERRKVAVPDFDSYTELEKVQARAEYDTQLATLRELLPECDIPESSRELSLEVLHVQITVYSNHVKKKEKVKAGIYKYRIYAAISWFLVELLAKRMGFGNMEGFVKYQMKYINSYESLLEELGEKELTDEGEDQGLLGYKQWSPEARFVAFTIFNALTFVAIKILAGWLGEATAEKTVHGFLDFLNNAGNGEAQEGQNADMGSSLLNMFTNGNLDLGGLIGSLGTMLGNNNQQQNNSTSAPRAQQQSNTGTPSGRRYRPAYEE